MSEEIVGHVAFAVGFGAVALVWLGVEIAVDKYRWRRRQKAWREFEKTMTRANPNP